ncbi:MAG TPA: PKD domain-containing protein [Bacteroidia bacterium]|nr:PKD domain-containing protein [Bacteroidia bacterium]
MKTLNKIQAAAALLLTVNAFATAPPKTITLSVTENSNMTTQQVKSMTFAFSTNGTDELDAYDSGNSTAISTDSNTVSPFSVTPDNDIISVTDTRFSLNGHKAIPVGFATKIPATIKILATVGAVNPGDTIGLPAYVWIERISTGEVYSILGDTLKLDIPANDNFSSDFVLHTGTPVMNVASDESCFGALDGTIEVYNPGCNQWTLSLYDSNNALVQSFPVYNPDTTIENLGSGTYNVVSKVGAVPVDSSTIVVNGPAEIIADFWIDNYNPFTSDVVNFYNVSSGAVSYSWDFGDGNTDTSENASHQYLLPGNYGVVLTAMNASGCVQTVYDSVYVTAPSSLMNGPGFDRSHTAADASNSQRDRNDMHVTVTTGEQKITVAQQDDAAPISVQVLSMNGQLVASGVSSGDPVAFSVPQAGVYIVKIVSGGQMKSESVLVSQ